MKLVEVTAMTALFAQTPHVTTLIIKGNIVLVYHLKQKSGIPFCEGIHVCINVSRQCMKQ